MSRKTELIRRNILNENHLIENEMMTAKLSNVRTDNILMVHQHSRTQSPSYARCDEGLWPNP
jgi:hypothetical protein